MKRNVLNITLSSFYGIAYTLMIFTFPICFILFNRWFFYSQINYLHLLSYLHSYNLDFTYLDVKNAYDALMDSLLFNFPFSEGKFYYSESGMNHFLDCIPLFFLCIITFLVSFVIFFILFILNKKKIFTNLNIKGYSSLTITPLILVLFFIIIAICALINFFAVFQVFHSIFFPGKDNWIFIVENDPIILIFPEVFFINCALFIAIFFVVFALIPFINESIKKYKEKKKSKDLQNNIKA